jgi:GT2 family glycosyltransferase
MFLLFKSEAFRAVGGFEEAYFLYYEDVEICARLKREGRSVLYNPNAIAIHAAQRASRKNPRLAFHHLSSLARFFSRGKA